MSTTLPTDESYIALTTVARVNNKLGRADSGATDPLIHQYSEISALIRSLSRGAQHLFLKRVIKKAEYDERHDSVSGFPAYYMSASPIDPDSDITVIHNTDQPRDFSDDDDEIESKYILTKPELLFNGIIQLDNYSLPDCNDALKFIYTGGMASQTALTGSDGATATTTIFTSAGSDFTALGVQVGRLLALTGKGATDHGVHKIAAVGTTTLTVETAFTATATGLSWEIMDSGLDTIVGEKWGHIADAIDEQAYKSWQGRSTLGVKSINVDGDSTTFFNPNSWDVNVKAILMEAGMRA